MEFSSPQIADEAIKMINGYKLDKLHTFAVNHFSDIWHHRNLSDKWVIPEPKKYVNRVRIGGDGYHIWFSAV